MAAAFSNNIKPLAKDTEYKEGDIVYVDNKKKLNPKDIQKNMFNIIKEIHLVLTKENIRILKGLLPLLHLRGHIGISFLKVLEH